MNVVLFYSGSQTTFVIGLAMTTAASVAFAGNLAVAIGLAGLTIAFYFVVGLYAQQQKLWAFYLGLTVYILDGLLYVFFQDWMPVAFHALAAFFIFKGIVRVRALATATSRHHRLADSRRSSRVVSTVGRVAGSSRA